MRKSALYTLLLAGTCLSTSALAQGCGPTNPNCIVPLRPLGDNTNSAASTKFIQETLSGGGTGTFSPGQVLGNGTSGTTAPTPTQLSPIFDQSIGSTRGSILERGSSGWQIVTPGTSGLPWVSNGAGADGAYQALTSTGLANPLSAGTSLFPVPTGFEFNSTSAFAANTLGAKNIVAGTPAATSVCCTWLNTYLPGVDSVGLVTVYGIAPSSSVTGWTAVFAARSSDNTNVSPQNIIPLNCVNVHDNTSVAHLNWCGYDAAYITSSATHSRTLGREISVFNSGAASTAEDPFNVNPTVPSSEGVRVDCAAAGGFGGNDCGAAYSIVNNGAKFISGINFMNASLDTGVNAVPPAIQLPSSYAVTWYTAAATVSGRVYIDSNSKGWVTPAAGANVQGTNTNDSASAGFVGELISATVNSPGSSVSSGVSANITSISLTAGDWDVDGQCVTVPTATTTVGQLMCSLNTVTSTSNTTAGYFSIFTGFATTPNLSLSQQVMPTRFSLGTTTSIFLVANNGFGTSTETVYGVVRGRRVR